MHDKLYTDEQLARAFALLPLAEKARRNVEAVAVEFHYYKDFMYLLVWIDFGEDKKSILETGTIDDEALMQSVEDVLDGCAKGLV